jgi:hypothetical protein
MQDFLRYRDKVMIISAILAGVAVLFFAQSGRLDISAGLALGGGWSIAKLWLRARRLQKTTNDKDVGSNVRYTLTGNFMLYVLTAVVLATAFAVDGINRWAAVAGLFVTNAVMVVCEGLAHAGVALQRETHQGER